MFDKKMCGLMMLGLSSLTLMGCDSSDSDDDSETDSAYIQFYNASANSTATSLVMDEYEYTSVAFSDSMPRYSYATGSVTMEIYGSDENGDSISIYSEDMDLDKEENHLFVLYGDYHSPELLKVIYDRSDIDDLNSDEDNEYSKMQVLVANVTAEEMAFDAYISLDTDSYADATMIGSVDYRGVTSELMLDTDDYIVYLTDKGTDNVVYTTSSMSLTTETVYKFMIRTVLVQVI
ncbi:hypothetical protein [Shewanella sp. UCD-KL21]|uniref:hypothetical protein n=1 Tax=Shewanella sp. UCD-KL21 TaxID=1917164 RepID=UPI0020C93DEC|nr:hypothetical protein [Shewanella sp. UCD-KL21]